MRYLPQFSINTGSYLAYFGVLAVLGGCSSGPADEKQPCPGCGQDGGGVSQDGGGSASDGSFSSHGGMVDSSDGGAGSGITSPGVCADVDVQAHRVTPTVVLIVDQSGSMDETFDNGSSRWDVLRSFLLDSGGLIADLQKQVRFGLAMYSAHSIADGTAVEGECPVVTSVAPKLSNYAAIAKVYNAAEPIKETPTGDSINKVVADLKLVDAPDADVDPMVFILATDGEPDRCEDPNPTTDQGRLDARNESIDAVKAAFKKRIRTFIISVGNGSVSAQHQQDVANAGVGHKAGQPDAEFWVAGDDATLRKALQDIIGSQLSCDIKLQGAVDMALACEGTVLLGGVALPCNGKNGWKLIDSTHLRVQGSACTTLKTQKSATLHVTFPCGVPVLF